jgi:hypothetical protein
VLQRTPGQVASGVDVCLGLGGKGCRQPPLFLDAQPLRLFGPVGQHLEHEKSEQNGRHSPKDEHELPSVDTHDVVHAHQDTGDRRGDDHGHRYRCHEERVGACAGLGGEPEREVEDHTREETSFCHPDEKPDDIEAGLIPSESRERGQNAPRQCDAGEPGPCPEFTHKDVARHFEEDVAEEQDAGAKAVGSGSEAQLGVHLQRCVTDVRAVDDRDDAEQHGQPHHLAHHLLDHEVGDYARRGLGCKTHGCSIADCVERKTRGLSGRWREVIAGT